MAELLSIFISLFLTMWRKQTFFNYYIVEYGRHSKRMLSNMKI